MLLSLLQWGRGEGCWGWKGRGVPRRGDAAPCCRRCGSIRIGPEGLLAQGGEGGRGGRLRAGMQACEGGGGAAWRGEGALPFEWGNALFSEGLGGSGRGEGARREKTGRARGIFAGTIKKPQLFVDFAVDESKG